MSLVSNIGSKLLKGVRRRKQNKSKKKRGKNRKRKPNRRKRRGIRTE